MSSWNYWMSKFNKNKKDSFKHSGYRSNYLKGEISDCPKTTLTTLNAKR